MDERQSAVAASAADSAAALLDGIALIDLLGISPTGRRLAELAQAVGLPEDTALGLLAVLVEASVVQESDDGIYRLGARCAVWGSGD